MVQTDLGPPLSKYKEDSVDDPVSDNCIVWFLCLRKYLRCFYFPLCTRDRFQLQASFLLQYHIFVFSDYLCFLPRGLCAQLSTCFRRIAPPAENLTDIDGTRIRLLAIWSRKMKPTLTPSTCLNTGMTMTPLQPATASNISRR